MDETITITARPAAPRTKRGTPGAYGRWEAVVTLPDGSAVWAGGHGPVMAVLNAMLKASAQMEASDAAPLVGTA